MRLTNHFAFAVLIGLLAACDPSAPRITSDGGGLAPATHGIERGQVQRGSTRQHQAAFLNRIRQSDPQFQTIQKAVLNEQNELGLIVNRNVDMDSIPKLMRAMLTQMAKEFPGQDLTVMAYAPTDPPMKIGTGRLDAQTRQMTYTPAR